MATVSPGIPSPGSPSPNDEDDDIEIIHNNTDHNQVNDRIIGTSGYSFVPHKETNDRKVDFYYQHISAINEYVYKSPEELRFEDIGNIMDQKQRQQIQQYLSTIKGRCFISKQTRTGGVPQGTVGCVVESKERKGTYCAIFIKPYDNIEYTITNTTIFSFS